MSDATLNDVLNVDLSDYTTAPYNVKSDKVNTPKVMSLSDVLRGTVIGSEWKTPTVDTLTSLRDRVPTAAEDFVWSLGSNTVDAVKRIVPTVAIQAMAQPVATTAGLIAGNVGIAAGAKIGSSLAVSNWWKTALGFLGGAAGGLAYGVGAGVLINELTPTETAKPEYDNPLNPDYQYRMLRELDDKHTKGDISDAEYESTKNEYLKFINDSKKILHDAAINKNEKNEIVDLLDGREYADASLVDSVVSWGAEALKDNKDFRTWQMEQREMNPEGIANTAGTIIANLIPYYAVSYLYRDALLKPKLKTVYPGNRFREKVEEIPTSLSREQVTEKVENLAKAYATVQMGTDYAAQNILDYIEKTGDTNLVNYQPSTMQGAMSASYGAIGAMTEFELGGIEPLITGSFKKVGLKLPVLKAGVKAGGQEAVEEVAQNLEEFLARNIDDTNKKTWGELLTDSVKSGVWALLMGGTIGSATYAINRANLVKGIVKYGNGTISEEQATQVADTMIEMAEGTVDYAKKERIDKLKSYVSAIYSDIDMPEAEKADVVNSIAGLEYALISQWNTMNGTDIADDPLFKGEVNDLGWFRTGIPADAKERIDKYFAEIAENEEKKKNLEGWMEKAREAKNTELLKKLGEQLEEIESKIDMLRSDRYRLDLVSGLAVENKRAIIAELNRRRKQLKGVVDQRLEEKGKRRAIKSKKADVEFQRVYAAMRGELSGDALDFDRYLGYGEKASAWFGGNYALKSLQKDFENYFKKFEIKGPDLRYDGEIVDSADFFNKKGIYDFRTRDKIAYSTSIFDTKERVVADLERGLKLLKKDYDAKVQRVINDYKNALGEARVREIIADIEEIVKGKGAVRGATVKFDKDLAPKEYEIQQKYMKDGELDIDFINVYVDLVNTFAADNQFENPFLNAVVDIKRAEDSLEKVKQLDWDKFSGKTGLAYKGKDAEMVLSQIISDITKGFTSTSMGWFSVASEIEKEILDTVKTSLVHNKNITDALKELEPKYKKIVDSLPVLKREIKDFVKKLKSNYPEADAKMVEQKLIEFASGISTVDYHSFMDFLDRNELTGQNYALADAVTYKEYNQTLYPEDIVDKEEKYKTILDLMYSIRAANTKLKALKAVEKEFKNNKDFIYKPKASLYAFEAPENDVLLVSNRPLNKQPKKVQEGIKNLIRDYGKQLPFLNYYVSNPVAMDELLWLFGIDDGQGDFDIALMKDMQNNMMESGFLSNSFNAIERRIERLLRNATNNALNEKGQDATVKDLIIGLEKDLSEIKPSKSAPNSFQEEYQDIIKIVDVLKRKLLEKHKEDEVLTDLLSIYEPEFKDVTGKKFYDDVVHNLTILPEKIKQLKKDKSLGILPNNPPQIIASKLFRKYGIMGGRYYGRADGYGFVTFDKTPMVERLYQIDETTKISPLMYNDFQYRNTLIHLYDNDSKMHVVEPRLVLPDGNVLSISGLTISLYPNASNSPSESIWKFYESEGGQSLVPFRNIWQSLLNNIKIQLKGDVAYKKGSYEVLSEAENKELLLKALENTKKDLIKEDIGSELKAQIAVVDALIENIENDYIQPTFNEVVSLSDGTHLVTHGISGTSDEILEFLKEGKVYNPSLYIAEKPSEYGYRSVVLFARPDVLKDKKTKIYDRDAYTSALSREPITYKTETPDEEKIKDAYYIYDKYFNADYDIYFRTEPTMLAFAKTMERGLENTKKKFTAYDVFSDLTKKYIIADALERGLVKVDTETIRRINNENKESIPTSKLEELFGIQKGLMRSEAIIQAADKALDLIAEQENKTREEILDSYKEIATNTVKIVQSTGELATPANIAKAQRENKLKYGRWRDLFPSSYYGKPSYDILTSDMTSGVVPSMFTRELTFDKAIAEKRKTGRRSENIESRKKIHKYAILAAQGNLMAHGKVYAAFLPPRIKKTDVESYMRAMRYDPNSIVDHGNADSIVKEIEKMAKRFNKIFKTLTPEEQEKLINGKVAEESDFEDKLISELEKNGVKNKLVLRYAVDLMKEVYYHPVTYFEGKILSDVDLSDFVGAYVNEEPAFDKIARLLEDKGLVVVRGRPSDVKSATIRLEQEAGEDIRFQNRPSGSAPSTYRGAYVPALRFILKANRMDASSLAHELAHDWFEVYASHALSGKASKEFMRSWGALEKAIGLDLEQPGSLSKASETFARAYEAWILNKEDWAKMVAISDKDKSEIVNLFKRYQDHLREIYNNVVNPYFKSTWGKVGELKPELRNWFDRMVEVESIDGMLERGEITAEQADQERLNRAINTVIENTEDVSNKNQLKYALALNDTKRYEVEGGNKNALQRRIGALAQAIDENNMLIKENYDTRRDMLEVARQADNFVRTRLDDALAIINGQMAEQEGLFKEDIYTALERLALENGDLGLLDELKNSEIANRLAKELGQRVAGFRNWNAGEVDVVSAIKTLDNRFNKALQNKKAQTELNNAERMFAKEQEQQDKLADKELSSILKDLECK